MPTFQTVDHERDGRSLRRDEMESERRRFPWWLAILALAAGLIGGSWYGYSRLAGHDDLLGQLKGWPDAVATVRQQVAVAEQNLQALGQTLGERLDRQMAAGLERVQKGTRDLGLSLRKEIAAARKDARDATGAQERATETRFRELEIARQSEAARTAVLEQEIAQLNTRLAGVGTELDNVRGATARASEQLRQEIRSTDGRVTQVASYNNRARDRFEATRGQTQQIAPGILLHITRTDPRYRRFAGWIQLVNDDGRFLWLRDQSMLQPVAFHAGKDALRYDLLVTGLTNGGVTGYVIFPRQGELAGAESVSSVGDGSGGLN